MKPGAILYFDNEGFISKILILSNSDQEQALIEQSVSRLGLRKENPGGGRDLEKLERSHGQKEGGANARTE
jgi:hypothetical protein